MLPVIMLAINSRALFSLSLLDMLCLTRPSSGHSSSFSAFGHSESRRALYPGDIPNASSLHPHHRRHASDESRAFLAAQHYCNVHHCCQSLVRSESMAMSFHHFVDGTLTDVTHMRLKEVSQDPGDERGRYPNPHTSNQDIRSGGRVGYALYFHWGKFCLSGAWTQTWLITLLLYPSDRGFGLAFH